MDRSVNINSTLSPQQTGIALRTCSVFDMTGDLNVNI